MKKTIFLVLAAATLLLSCDLQKTIVPASRAELHPQTGFVSPGVNTTQGIGDQFSVKLWIYSHYSFNKITVSKQTMVPGTPAPVTVMVISSTTPGVSFSTNYTTTISGVEMTTSGNDGDVQRWNFTVTDNQGKEFGTYIDITLDSGS